MTTTANTCGNCAHHRLTGPLAERGYGFCQARVDPVMRASIVTSERSVCRISRFQAKNPDDAVLPPKITQRAPQAPSEASEVHS